MLPGGKILRGPMGVRVGNKVTYGVGVEVGFG